MTSDLMKLRYQLHVCNCICIILRNRKHFPSLHTVIETRVEVWENKKLKWENKFTE